MKHKFIAQDKNKLKGLWETIKPFAILCLVLGIFIFSFSCNDKPANTLELEAVDSVMVERFIKEKAADSLLNYGNHLSIAFEKIAADKQVAQLNQWLFEKTAIINVDWKQRQALALNVIKFGTKLIDSDTTLEKQVANAYYQWAELSFRNEQRNDDSVLICFEKALSMDSKRESLPKWDRVYAYKTLGIKYNQLGDLRKSLMYYNQENQYIDKKYTDWFAGNAINRAIALNEIGLRDSAISICNNVLDNPKVGVRHRAQLLNILSEALTSKSELEKAFDCNSKALYLLDTVKSKSPSDFEKLSAILKQKSILQIKQGQGKSAIETIRTAISNYESAGGKADRYLAKMLVIQGQCFYEIDEQDSALSYFQLALSKIAPTQVGQKNNLVYSGENLYAENTFIEAFDAQAASLKAKHEATKEESYLSAAINAYKLSFEVEQKLLNNFSYDESRAILLQQSKLRSEHAIEICYELRIKTNETKWTDQAFEFAEKSKAIVLLESVRRNLAANTFLQNDATYQKIQYLNNRLISTEKEIASYQAEKSDSLAALAKTQKLDIEKQLLNANIELSRNNSKYKQFMELKDAVSIVAIQEQVLNSNSTLIEYFYGDSSAYVFAISNAKPTLFLKLSDSINNQVATYLSFFTSRDSIINNPALYEQSAHNLYKSLFTFSEELKGVSNYLIVADGPLSNLPFEPLVVSITGKNNPKQFNYLLNKATMSYHFSGGTILEQAKNKENSKGSGVLALAPGFENKERGLQILSNTKNELEDLRTKEKSGQYYFGKQATLSTFLQSQAKADIIYLATHAKADSISGQAKIEFIDSSLELSSIYDMRTHANLVVLSGCETGIGQINKNEGALSLARGFYYAGAKNIITSLWQVDDKSTAALFNIFYENGLNINYSNQLQIAKKKYIEQASTANASPYYWAAFVHIGYQKAAGREVLNWWWLLGAIPLLWYFLRKRNKT